MENKQDVEKLHTGLAAEFLLISPFDCGLTAAAPYKLAQSEDAQKASVRFMVFCPTINIPRVGPRN